ncbi:hypothetical protein MTR67_005990 [Solanum verrucosum]|uniref:Uncharacterized protein n=1 Tax=Solanum verrucosum TaxID=315347 RepID=A0AAF0PZE2_SOLVR|nr:hypothetical protein MTR67_005990 [Solanum verrucosum]
MGYKVTQQGNNGETQRVHDPGIFPNQLCQNPKRPFLVAGRKSQHSPFVSIRVRGVELKKEMDTMGFVIPHFQSVHLTIRISFQITCKGHRIRKMNRSFGLGRQCFLHLMACNYREDEVFLSSILYLLAMSPQTFKVLPVLSGGSGLQGSCFGDQIRIALYTGRSFQCCSMLQILSARLLFEYDFYLKPQLKASSEQEQKRSTLLLMENIPAVCLASSTALGCQHPSPSAIQAIKHTFLGAIPPVIQAIKQPFLVLKEVVHTINCAFAHEAPGVS